MRNRSESARARPGGARHGRERRASRSVRKRRGRDAALRNDVDRPLPCCDTFPHYVSPLSVVSRASSLGLGARDVASRKLLCRLSRARDPGALAASAQRAPARGFEVDLVQGGNRTPPDARRSQVGGRSGGAAPGPVCGSLGQWFGAHQDSGAEQYARADLAERACWEFSRQRDRPLSIELWDSKTVNDHPIGIKDMGPLSEEVQHLKEADLECDTGAQVRVAFEPPHARMGLGLHYELRVGEAYVTRVYEESPAGRAGLKAGDRILSLEGREVSAMKSLEVQSSLNTPHVEGLAMKVRHRGGEELAVTLKDGPIYPLFAEIGTLR